MSITPAELQVAQRSETGRARPHNEDYVDHYVPQDPQQLATKGALYLVADGMGGHQAGEVASRAAVDLVIDQYYRDVTHDIGSSLVRAFRAANRMINEQAEADPSKAGMGTTLVAAVIVGQKVYVASVGDSRAYLVGQGRIAQITEDHSWVQEQIRAGMLTAEQARQHPQRNVVTRALGSKPSVEVDLFEGQIGEGDVVLMCSDGLSGLLEDREMQAIVESRTLEDACRDLVALANERGGGDNITVLIVGHRPAEAARRSPEGPSGALGEAGPPVATRAKSKPVLLAVATVVGLALIVAIGVLVARLLAGPAEPVASATPDPTGLALTAAAAGTPVLTATLGVTPTATTIITPTDTVPSPQGTAMLSGSPTVTLIPSRTATPTRTPGPPAPTKSPTATGTRDLLPGYPPVELAAPVADDATPLSGAETFEWRYNRPLKTDEAFQVLIWRQGSTGEHAGAAAPTTEKRQSINLDDLLSLRGGSGKYFWSVVVVRVDDGRVVLRLSDEAAPWSFTYAAPSQPPESTAAPTKTPAQPVGTLQPPGGGGLPTIGPMPTVGG